MSIPNSSSPEFTTPTPDLDDLYKFRGTQTGCGYGGARLLFATITGLVGLFFLGSCAALLVYINVARDLPPASELKQRASTFNATRILDRNGKLLYEIDDPNAGRRIVVPIEQIPS